MGSIPNTFYCQAGDGKDKFFGVFGNKKGRENAPLPCRAMMQDS